VVASMPNMNAPAPNVAAEAVSEGKAEKPKKKIPRWAFIVGGIFIFFCCIFLALASRGNRNNRAQLATSEAVTQSAATVAPDLPGSATPGLPPPNGIGTRPGPKDVTPSTDVLEAQRLVDQNPRDAQAQLQLALAYWDNDQPRLAYDTLSKASALADPNDTDFFMQAAQAFVERKAWVGAATMYARVIQLTPADPLPADIEEPFHESVYQAAVLPEFQTFFPVVSSPDGGRDEFMSLIGQGRAALYRGEFAKANELLAQAKNLKPDMPEATLLDAEIRLRDGARDEALRLFRQLSSDPTVPEWIKNFVSEMPKP